MADLDYKKENMKELHAPDKKVKAGVYVIAALLVLVYLLPIYVMLNQSFRFIDRSVAETVSAGKMDTG